MKLARWLSLRCVKPPENWTFASMPFAGSDDRTILRGGCRAGSPCRPCKCHRSRPVTRGELPASRQRLPILPNRSFPGSPSGHVRITAYHTIPSRSKLPAAKKPGLNRIFTLIFNHPIETTRKYSSRVVSIECNFSASALTASSDVWRYYSRSAGSDPSRSCGRTGSQRHR